MKYNLMLVMLLSGPVAAQIVATQKPIDCVDTALLFKGLSSRNYKEEPIWTGTEPGVTLSRYSLFVNDETKSWTFIQFDNKVACVIGAGEASTQIFNRPKI